MKRIGARPSGGIQHGCARTSELSAEVRGLHLELLNRIERRQHYIVGAIQKIHGVGVVINSVQQVVVLCRPIAVGGKGTVFRVAAGIGLWRIHARSQLCQKGEISAIQRQIFNRLLVDHLADRSVFRL